MCNHVLITLRLGNNMLSWKESCDITCNTICSFWFLFISHIDVESPGFRFDQQEICDQFIREVAGFNEDTLAFILFLLNFSKFDAKISLRLVTQHCCGFKNELNNINYFLSLQGLRFWPFSTCLHYIFFFRKVEAPIVFPLVSPVIASTH